MPPSNPPLRRYPSKPLDLGFGRKRRRNTKLHRFHALQRLSTRFRQATAFTRLGWNDKAIHTFQALLRFAAFLPSALHRSKTPQSSPISHRPSCLGSLDGTMHPDPPGTAPQILDLCRSDHLEHTRYQPESFNTKARCQWICKW